MSPIRMLLAAAGWLLGTQYCRTIYNESPRKDRSRLSLDERHRTPSIKRNIPYRPRSTVSGVSRKMGRGRPQTNTTADCPVFP